MTVSNIGSGGTDVLVSEDQINKVDVNDVNYDLGEGLVEAKQISMGAKVNKLTTKSEAGKNAVFTGKGLVDSTIVVKSPTSEEPTNRKAREENPTSIIRLENTLNENVLVNVKKGATAKVVIAEGKFRKSEVDMGNGKKTKSDDTIEIGSSAKLINSSFNLKKGDDTFILTGGAKLKKTNTVDLGKGGTDKVIIGNNTTGKGKLVIENMDKRDTLSYGGEDYTKKQIKNGEADIPGFIELG